MTPAGPGSAPRPSTTTSCWCCAGCATGRAWPTSPTTRTSRSRRPTATSRVGLDVIAERAPDLHDVLQDARDRGLAYLCLDGTLIPTDRVAVRTVRGNNTWYSGKNHQFSGNIQVLSDPNGHPLWVSAVRPGSVHDLTCARELVLPALYPHCRLRPDGYSHLPVLADKGYIGAGIGIRVPHRRPRGNQVLSRHVRTYNRFHATLRAPSERANALLQHWHALDRVTLDPWALTKIAAAALVLTRLQLPTR